MVLRTFGRLELEGSDFSRPKPLLLLAYLSLEGPKERRFLAELFWMGATDPLNRLSSTLTRLRRAHPDLVEADDIQVAARVESDAHRLLRAVEMGAMDEAASLYRGPFLKGVYFPDWSAELEEWVYETREFLARRFGDATLSAAEREAGRGRFVEAVRLAEAVFGLLPDADPSPDALERLHTLLAAGGSPRADEVRAEADGFDLSLAEGQAEARARLRTHGAAPGQQPAPTLPTKAGTLVGRERERVEIVRLLTGDVRLLTILGPAGVGKTRLAMRIARDPQLQDAFPDGVHVVPLEGLTAAAMIASSVADALGVAVRGAAEPVEQVVDAIGDRAVLLVLDNFEHVIEGALVVAEWIRRGPRLRVLVTSRERLNVEGEQAFPLSGLPYPEAVGARPEVEDAEGFDAIQLFVQKARQAGPYFRLEDANVAHVVRICALVEGLPLGIELAAAWVRAMPCEDIADEIARNLDLLTTSARDATQRHQSIHSAFEYSWRLLGTVEQDVYRRMGAFQGGFRRDAASAVAGATIPNLAALADKSLLRLEAGGRYAIHPLLHQYLRGKLAEAPAVRDEVDEAHARFYLGYLGRWGAELRGGGKGDALDALASESENLLRAWRSALERGWMREVRATCSVLESMFVQRNRFREGIAFFREAAGALDPRDAAGEAALGAIWVCQGWLELRLGRLQDARRAASKGLELLRAVGDVAGTSEALNILGSVAGKSGRFEEAKRHFVDALASAHDADDPRHAAMSRNNLGIVEKEIGNYAASAEHYAAALAANRELGNHVSIARNANNLGSLYFVLDRLDDAEAILLEGVALARERHFEQTLPHLLGSLGSVYIEQERFDEARACLREALETAGASGERDVESDALRNLARIELACGELGAARRHLVASLEIGWGMRSALLVTKAFIAFSELALRDGTTGRAEDLLRLVARHPGANRHTKSLAHALMERHGLEADPELASDDDLHDARLRNAVESILADAIPKEPGGAVGAPET